MVEFLEHFFELSAKLLLDARANLLKRKGPDVLVESAEFADKALGQEVRPSREHLTELDKRRPKLLAYPSQASGKDLLFRQSGVFRGECAEALERRDVVGEVETVDELSEPMAAEHGEDVPKPAQTSISASDAQDAHGGPCQVFCDAWSSPGLQTLLRS